MTIRPLTKFDVTRYPICGVSYSWLTACGFRVKIYGDRVFMVRQP